ncbi:MAG: hypothetical protein RJB39_466 [Candidatus Parcubacteria bacterium]|jgi:hypothetical protein
MSKKLFFPSVLLFVFSVSISTFAADGVIDVNIRVIDSRSADITLTYPTPYQESTFNTLPSKMVDATGLDGTYQLLSASNGLGEKRDFRDFTDGNGDSIVYSKPTDTSIIVTYRLTNALPNNDLSLFRFPLAMGANYPRMAKINITYPSTMNMLAYPNSENIVTIPKMIQTTMALPNSTGDYFINDVYLLLNKKYGTYVNQTVGGRFLLAAPKNLVAPATRMITALTPALGSYQTLLGGKLPPKIVVAVSPIRRLTKQYESAAVTVSKNIVLFDTDHFNPKISELLRKKILAHELTHVVLGGMNLFKSEKYNARWLDEGLSVFMEQYISDNYLYKGLTPAIIKQQSDTYRKPTKEELNEEYKDFFDFGFSVNQTPHMIERTYSHAGLIFYNLYLQNKTWIPTLLQMLTGLRTGGNCDKCDTDNILYYIKYYTKLEEDEVIYPYDKEVQVVGAITNPILDKLISK